MRRVLKYLLIVICFFSFYLPVNAKNKVTIYFFHGRECPHCREEDEFLNNIKNDYDNLEIEKYEVWYNEQNAELLDKVRKYFDVEKSGVPFTVIGSSHFVGYNDVFKDTIRRAINYYQENEYEDVVSKIESFEIKSNEKNLIDPFLENEEESDKDLTVDALFLGKINLKKISISSAAIIIGLVDGFNPCAMWILLFLISVLIGMKEKKKMWIYGLSFLITSALVYMFFMFSWVNIVIRVTTSIIIRNIIALIALCGAGFNLYSFIKSRKNGCIVVSSDRRKNIFERIRKFTHNKSFVLGLLGIMGLAISVNLVELACSAGLPLIFTELLAINNVKGLTLVLYVFLYIIFFLLDDLIVFFIAMFTMKITGLSTKFSKYSHLLGAILMFIIGILLLFRPEWLMF